MGNFIFFYSMDDLILRNNTFREMSYLKAPGRHFLEAKASLECDHSSRTAQLIFEGN